jgi:hypothetical protein
MKFEGYVYSNRSLKPQGASERLVRRQGGHLGRTPGIVGKQRLEQTIQGPISQFVQQIARDMV